MRRLLFSSTLLFFLCLVPLSATSSVYAFFYLWYGNPETDGKYLHWDHSLLPHWTPSVRAQYPENIRFLPPHDIHSPFYPQRGLYSSRDATVMKEQFEEMKAYGIGVAVVSWWGRPGVSEGDSQGVVTDTAIELVLESASKAGIQVALHLEPYTGRSVESVRLDIEYLIHKYGAHPAFHRVPSSSSSSHSLPVFFVYDSYHIPVHEWKRLLTQEGDISVRSGSSGSSSSRSRGSSSTISSSTASSSSEQQQESISYDGYFIGLWLNHNDGSDLAAAGFDGAYTYFATDGFSYGSSLSNWASMSRFASSHGLSFIPSVSPGYDDSKIRPWNAGNTRPRNGGEYYRRMWETALSVNPSAVSITSFNEWGEGTQIEPAARKRLIDVAVLAPQGLALNQSIRDILRLKNEYEEYSPSGDPTFYLEETLAFSKRLHAQQQQQQQVFTSEEGEAHRSSLQQEL